MMLNRNAKSQRIEGLLNSLNLKRKELNGALRKISCLHKSKRSKSNLTESKEEMNSFSRRTKDSRVTKAEKATCMELELLVYKDQLLEQAILVNSIQIYSDSIYLKVLRRKRIAVESLQAKCFPLVSQSSLVTVKEMKRLILQPFLLL